MDIGRVRALCAVRCKVHGVLRLLQASASAAWRAAALCASETGRRQAGSVCIAAHVSFSRTREWCRATTHRPPGPLPLQSLSCEAQCAVHLALSTMPQSRRPHARGHAQPWSALMREQVLGPHKLALMAVGSSRGKPTGRYAWSTGGRGRASSTWRATARRAPRVRLALTARVRRRAEDRPLHRGCAARPAACRPAHANHSATCNVQHVTCNTQRATRDV